MQNSGAGETVSPRKKGSRPEKVSVRIRGQTRPNGGTCKQERRRVYWSNAILQIYRSRGKR